MDEIMKIKTDEIKLLRKPIDTIGLPDNLCWNLRCYGDIKTVKKLAETDAADLLKIYGVGDKSIEIIKEKLEELGLTMIDSRKPVAPRLIVRNMDFPENLLCYIKEKKSKFVYPENITDDIIKGIRFASTTLTDEYQVALFLRFEKHKSLSQIGYYFSLSGTQIENIIEKAISALFINESIKYIEQGLNGYINNQIMIRSDNLAEAKLAIEYRRGYDDAIAEMNGTNDESKSTQTSLTKTIE